MALYYLDASALVKLVREEPESPALRTFLGDSDLVSCELVLTEIPRAIRRAAADDPSLDLDLLLTRAGELGDALALRALDDVLLTAAGALSEPGLRALDAIHVIAAIDVSPIDAFVSYDERQSAAARLAGLRTMSPGPAELDGPDVAPPKSGAPARDAAWERTPTEPTSPDPSLEPSMESSPDPSQKQETPREEPPREETPREETPRAGERS